MIPLTRLKKLTMRNVFIIKHRQRVVRIRSGQWGAWWRPNRMGYTDRIELAGLYTLIEAWEATCHCGPEKEIYFDFVEKLIRPPLGVIPKFIWIEQRLDAISEAISRYKQAGWEVPPEWYEEHAEHAHTIIKLNRQQNEKN